ncbi:MAG: immunoglobulin domain-containing protein [Verrucomicrobiota bacterium]
MTLSRFPVLLTLSLSLPALASADTLEPAWAIVPSGTDLAALKADSRFTAANTQVADWFSSADGNVRCVASNPLNGNVLIVHANGETHVFNSAGVESHILEHAVVSGGDKTLPHVGVAEDGVVFGTNLSDSVPPKMRVYRWENDKNPDTVVDPEVPAVATTVFVGDPGLGANNQRWGDSFDVKGRGLDTKLLMGARRNSAICVFTTDGSLDPDFPENGPQFTPHVMTFSGTSPGMLGVAFGPDVTGYDDPATPTVENLTLLTVFTKLTGGVMNQVRIRTDTWTVVNTIPFSGTGGNPASVLAAGTALGTDRTAKFLGVSVAGTAGSALLYDISAAGASPTLIGGFADGKNTIFPTGNANVNGTAAADVFTLGAGQTAGANGIPAFSRFYALNTNNAVVAYDIKPSVIAPAVVTQPANVSVLDGWKASFTVIASGSAPISYQWMRGEADIPNATGPSLTLDPVTAADTGAVFKVRITNGANPGNPVLSNPATLTILPHTDTAVMTPAWKIDAGTRPYVNTLETQRGLAYNPSGDHLLLVNRTPVTGLPTPSVVVLNAATGAEILENDVARTLKLTGEFEEPIVAGGTYVLNMIDCGGDGAVYACNLAESATVGLFTIYRWADDASTTPPAVAYGPADLFASDRAGDGLKVRGTGTGTEILVGARNQEKFAIFTTTDGISFSPTVYEIPGIGASAFFMTDFGPGNTIWAKAFGGKLVNITYNPVTSTAAVTHTFTTAQFPAGVGPLAVDPVKNLLGGVNTNQAPDNLRLYNIANLEADPALLDLQFFPTDNPNLNQTGSADFGGNRLYALDTNNGLIAMNLNVPAPAGTAVISNPRRTGGDFTFTLTGTPGGTYLIQRSGDLSAWGGDGTVVLDAGGTATVTRPVTENRTFFRVQPQ